MKFFHLSDLHIGKQLHNYSLWEDQSHILQEVLRLATIHRPDAILISGDIYDKPIPSAEAVSLFDWFLTACASEVPDTVLLLIAGNHDSPKRLDFASTILERQKIHIAGMPPKTPGERLKKVTLTDAWGEVHFYLLPFVKPGYVAGVFPEETLASHQDAVEQLLKREQIDATARNVLLTHQFYTASGREPRRSDSEAIYVGGLDNIDVSVLAPFSYAALGHIHRPQSMGAPRYRYCGTLLPYSVSESKDEKTLTMVELTSPEALPVITELPLTPLRRVRSYTGTMEELLQMPETVPCEDYVSLTLTDEILPYQPREQLSRVYSRILELRVENARTRHQAKEGTDTTMLTDPVELFTAFYREIQGQELSEEQKQLLTVIAGEAKEESL